VNFPWPPFHFGNFPIAFSGQEALLAVASEPTGKPAAACAARRHLEAGRRRPFACKCRWLPDLSQRLRSIQAAPINQVIPVN
jgi:hypothetical protein